MGANVEIKATGCHGFCERGTLIVLYPEGILYQMVKPEDVPEILDKTVVGKELIERLLYVDPVSGERITYEKESPFTRARGEAFSG